MEKVTGKAFHYLSQENMAADNKQKEIVENHDCLCFEVSWHLKKNKNENIPLSDLGCSIYH